MYTIHTKMNNLIAVKNFFQKGINTSVPLEKGKLVFRAVDRFTPEIESFQKMVQSRVDEYNKKLRDYREEYGEKATVPSELLEEHQKINKEMEQEREKETTFAVPDDEYHALQLVVEQAIKVIYKKIQDDNEDDNNKDEVPNMEQYIDLQNFENDLLNAEKSNNI